jgi:hypothetical protein
MTDTEIHPFRVGRFILWLVLACLLGSVASVCAMQGLHSLLYLPFIMLAVAIPLAWTVRLLPGVDQENLAVFLGAIVLALAAPVTTMVLALIACLLENQFGGRCIFL